MDKQLISYIVPALVLCLVAWRMIRNMRGRPVKPGRLWIRPALLGVFLVLAFLHPPALTILSVSLFAAAAVLGTVLGYVIASHQTLSIDQATGTITSRTSPIGVVLFLGLLGLRLGGRFWLMQGGDPFTPHSSGPFLMYTDTALIFLVAMVAAQAWETWRRANPLLEGHRASQLAQNQAE